MLPLLVQTNCSLRADSRQKYWDIALQAASSPSPKAVQGREETTLQFSGPLCWVWWPSWLLYSWGLLPMLQVCCRHANGQPAHCSQVMESYHVARKAGPPGVAWARWEFTVAVWFLFDISKLQMTLKQVPLWCPCTCLIYDYCMQLESLHLHALHQLGRKAVKDLLHTNIHL